MYTKKEVTLNNVPVLFVKTDKFKTVSIQIKFRSQLNPSRVTLRNLLSKMMVKRTNTFTHETELLKYLAEFYGAYLTSNTQKKGTDHIVTFNLEFVNERFIREDLNVIEHMCQFLNEVLLSPKHYNNQIEDFLKKEKRLYLNHLKSMKDNKNQKSFEQFINAMFNDEDYRFLSNGEIKDIDPITINDLKVEHEKMLCEDDIYIIVVGNLTETMKQHLTKVFKRESLVELPYTSYPFKLPTEVKYSKATMDVSQSIVNLGFRYPIDQNKMALNVLNQLFGGSASSLLFKNVRERLSLCYQIHAQADIKNGYVFVFAGVDHQNIKITKNAILEQLETLKNGDFEQSQLDEVKDLMRTRRELQMDRPNGLSNIEYGRYLSQTHDHAFVEELKKITKEDIIHAATELKLDTVHVLTKEDSNEDSIL